MQQNDYNTYNELSLSAVQIQKMADYFYWQESQSIFSDPLFNLLTSK